MSYWWWTSFLKFSDCFEDRFLISSLVRQASHLLGTSILQIMAQFTATPASYGKRRLDFFIFVNLTRRNLQFSEVGRRWGQTAKSNLYRNKKSKMWSIDSIGLILVLKCSYWKSRLGICNSFHARKLEFDDFEWIRQFF